MSLLKCIFGDLEMKISMMSEMKISMMSHSLPRTQKIPSWDPSSRRKSSCLSSGRTSRPERPSFY
jgi:hypothetical protein